MPGKPLLLTLGDPNGLGPEITARLLATYTPDYPLVLIGPREPLTSYADKFASGPFWTNLDSLDSLPATPGIHLYCPPELDSFTPAPGTASPSGGLAAGLSLDAAMPPLLTGKAAGLVTCPLNKAMLNAAGFHFPGHTEYLAERSNTGRDKVCMHLCGPTLRVSLVTTHPPISELPALITQERVLLCLQLTADYLRQLDLDSKPIAVCGLNPHAGESGLIGTEEISTITPAIKQAIALGLNVAGPFPGDTIFHFAAQGLYPAVLAMYHDQGLAPLKLLHFGQAVNVTLGLPFVRTSVDHGTAYNIAGLGTADTSSLAEAIHLAEKLTK